MSRIGLRYTATVNSVIGPGVIGFTSSSRKLGGVLRESSMSDKQAKDLYAYIRTFKSTAPDLKEIPALNAIVAASKQERK